MLGSLAVVSSGGCGADSVNPFLPGDPCDAPAVECRELTPGGRGVIFECEDGEMTAATLCPEGTACSHLAAPSFEACLSANYRTFVPFAAEGTSCNEGVVHACSPTDDRFLVCVDGTWTDVCPPGFAYPPSCSAVYIDPDTPYEAVAGSLSCASEGGRCGREGSYECDDQLAFRCVGGTSVLAVDCGPFGACFANPDQAVCGKRFYAVAGDPCLAELRGIVGEPSSDVRVSCAIGDGAVLSCLDEVWVETETCAAGTRCDGIAGDVACR